MSCDWEGNRRSGVALAMRHMLVYPSTGSRHPTNTPHGVWYYFYLPLRISKTACPNFTKFSVHYTCGHGSVFLWRQCNMLCRPTFGFADDVMFGHNRRGQSVYSKWLARGQHGFSTALIGLRCMQCVSARGRTGGEVMIPMTDPVPLLKFKCHSLIIYDMIGESEKLRDSQRNLSHEKNEKNEKHRDSAYLRQGTSYQCRDPDPDPDPWSGSPPKFNHLFIGSLRTFPENFVQIRSEVFVQSC